MRVASQKRFQLDFNSTETSFSQNDILNQDGKHEDSQMILKEARKTAEIEKQEIIESGKKEAELILVKGRKEAENLKKEILQSTEIQGKKIREESRQQGYEEGFAQGKKETEGIIKEAKQVLKEAENEKEILLQEVEPRALELIIKICEKLLNASLIFNPESIIYLIKKGLRDIDEQEQITIMVSEEDFENVVNHKDKLGSFDSEKVKIQKSNALKKGDCMIETDYGNIQCSLSQQLEQIKQELAIIYDHTLN